MALLSIIPLAALGVLSTSMYHETFTLNTVIPDNDPAGFSDTQTIIADDITSITAIEVGLTFSDGWMGDLYASLSHDSGFTVLLNRIGRSSDNALGSPAASLDATFMVGAPDIHLATAPLNGNYSPDARTTDPNTVLDTDPRSADFTSLLGLPASGEWTLFIADVGPGEFATLDNWELTITGVPEPGATATLLGAFASVLALLRIRYQSHRRQTGNLNTFRDGPPAP